MTDRRRRDNMFERSTPAREGVSSSGIIRFLDEMKAGGLHMHDMMILRHGKVILESDFAPWSGKNLHMLFSLSKSFTSTAIGFAVQDGLLKLTDRLVDFFPEFLPAGPCENMKKVTVKHLLTMNTGHQTEPRHETECWEKEFVRTYIEHEPGTHFLYNTYGTYMLSAILQKVTGKKTLAYLREKFLNPLEMSPDIWTEESPTGVATGGYGMNVRVEDIAKMGQFYLQRGRWNGQQLLNEDWIRDAQAPWSDNSASREGTSDWNQGYGYQFWMCIPEHVFRGDGAFGQYCVICPDQDMVFAINSGVDDMGAVLKSIWENILPSLDGETEDDGVLEERLKHTCTAADWEEKGEEALEPTPEKAWIGRYHFQKENLLGLRELEIGETEARLRLAEGESVVPLQKDAWVPVELYTGKDEDPWGYFRKAAVRAARTGEGMALHLCYILTPFEDVLRIRFTEHGTEIRIRRNVNMGETEFTIVGYRMATD